MRVMVLVKATEESEKGFVLTPETKKMMEAMGKFNDELEKAGILVTAAGLMESSTGHSRIRTNWSRASGSGRSRTWPRRWPG